MKSSRGKVRKRASVPSRRKITPSLSEYAQPHNSFQPDPATVEEASDIPYQYEDLDRENDSIRLLLLQTAQPNVIKCELVSKTFREKPVYEALSYTWGNPEQPKKLIELGGTKFPVSENLFNALVDLRTQKSVEARVLWIDAICINQKNDDERAYQVGMMDYIFTRAAGVLIYLSGLRFSWQSDCDNYTDTYGNLRCENNSHVSWLSQVCNHDYWERLWIIQEVALATKLDLCFRNKTESWEDFLKFMEKHESPDPEFANSEKLVRNLDARRRIRHSSGNRLEYLLQAFDYAKCAEPRDKIYGLLGLAHDAHDDGFQVDYKKPLYDLYVDMIKHYINREALDETITKMDRSMRIVQFSRLVQKRLGTNFRSKTQGISDQFIVRVMGAFASPIIQLGPTYDEMISSGKALRDWKAIITQHAREVEKLRENTEAYFPVLLAMENAEVKTITSVDLLDSKSSLRSYGVKRPGAYHGNLSSRSVHEGLTYAHLDHVFEAPSASPRTDGGPRMFLGNGKVMGLAPCDARIGDVVCQFWGTAATGLLREHILENGDVIYRLVGKIHINTGRLNNLKPTYQTWPYHNNYLDAIDMVMDLDTLSFLTC